MLEFLTKKLSFRVIVLWLILIQATLAQAGIDEVFGEKATWWKTHYNKLLGSFGIEKNYALVVGVGNYKDASFQSLPSEKDAIRIKNYLINEAGFDHVRLITGDKVRLDLIQSLMLDHYPKILNTADRFLFYWSGHGLTTNDKRKQGYLAVRNSKNKILSSMLSMHDLVRWDNRIKARQTLYLLDACFSGMAASKAMSVGIKKQTIDRVSRPSSQVLTAGLEQEQTIAVSDINGGVFTRALLDGLRGHADTKKGPFNKDGVVTARELEIYIRSRVDHERRRVKWNKPITPTLYNFSRQEGDFFFVSDKSILKNPDELLKGSNVDVVGTGLRVPIIPESNKKQKIPKINYIVSKNGFSILGKGKVIFGSKPDSVYKIIGSPLKTKTWEGAKLDYHIYRNLDLAYNKTTGNLSHVIFRHGADDVMTAKGIKLGDSVQKILEVYGEPQRTSITFKNGKIVYSHFNFSIRNNQLISIRSNAGDIINGNPN